MYNKVFAAIKLWCRIFNSIATWWIKGESIIDHKTYDPKFSKCIEKGKVYQNIKLLTMYDEIMAIF